MRNKSISSLFALVCLCWLPSLSASAGSQPPAPEHAVCPQRTPEDIARKQTEVLVRDLDIRDSVLTDTIFHIHLKYAKMCQVSNTRAEHMERVQQMYAELRNVLTPEQYSKFMSQQLEAPRRPQPIGRMPQNNNTQRIPPGAAEQTKQPATSASPQ